MLISEDYKRLNIELHKTHPGYGSHGGKYVNNVLKLAQKYGAKSVLDYGCGKGALSGSVKNHGRQARSLKVLEYDPCIKGKGTPQPADMVVAFDVMEHIEPECLDDVLAHIHSLTGKCFYCVIATRAAKKILSDGRNAHLIIRPPGWWLKQLNKLFEVALFAEREDDLQCAAECTPRRINGADQGIHRI